MKKRYLRISKFTASLLFFIMISVNVFSQVGIGTVTPNASSVLEIASTTKGMLTPRMTTAQRLAIVSPADGLLVNDTDLKSFYYYISTTSTWTQLSSDANGRTKFKRIKAIADLAAEKIAGSNTKYLLDTTIFYEINGTILVDLPIELNNSYLAGIDSGEDKLVKVTAGDLFSGTTGGSIRVLTLAAGTGGVNLFNITGTGSIGAGTQNQNLIFRDCIVSGFANGGKLENFSLVFQSIVQFVSCTTGIVYKDISKILLSNVAWFGNNAGTYETFQGTFGLVEKTGGFSEVNGTAIGFDVSSNPTITGDAVMESVVFLGTLTTGKYVNPYTIGTYSNFNFNDSWTVRSAGIPTEGDAVATGDMNFDYAVGSGSGTVFNGSNPSNIVKVAGVSTSSNLYRFSRNGLDNRLQYLGKKKRIFQVSGSISFQVPASGIYIIYTAKNGTVISQYKIYGRGTVAADIIVLPVIAATEMIKNDYIEIFAQRFSGSNGDIVTPNMSIIVK